jgi:hypothetical protein
VPQKTRRNEIDRATAVALPKLFKRLDPLDTVESFPILGSE